MTIELANYISELEAANPEGASLLREVDDHIRLLKSVLKTTFPNLGSQVVATSAELNLLAGRSSLEAPAYGTFKVTFSAGEGAIDISPACNTFGYVRFGNFVFVHGTAVIESVSMPSGALNINGLPWAGVELSGFADHWPLTVIVSLAGSAFSGIPVARIQGGSSSILIQDAVPNSAEADAAGLMAAATQISLSGCYRRA